MPKDSKQQDYKFHNWVMSHPTEEPYPPPTIAKHPPPTLRHLLIERVQAAREMAAEWVEELRDQSEEEDQDPDDSTQDLEDPKYDW